MKKIFIVFIFLTLILTNKAYSCNLIIFEGKNQIDIKSFGCKIEDKIPKNLANSIFFEKIQNGNKATINLKIQSNLDLYFEKAKFKNYKSNFIKTSDNKFQIVKIYLEINSDSSINTYQKSENQISIKILKKQITKDNKKKNKIIAIIDAGHGGRDSGTISVTRKIKEKDITLSYAFELKKKLEEKGIKVILTRNGDYYIPLRRRVEIASEKKGDIFISIHADYIRSKKIKGASIYTISNINRKHTDRKLFQYESYVPKFIIETYNSIFSNTIIDLYHSISRDHSKKLGLNILKYFQKNKLCVTCKVKDASFAVLRRINMPSILIEVGYLSNDEDEKNILLKSYQYKILDSVTNGILDYIKEANV